MRLAVAAVLLLVGLASGLAAVALHQLPWGLALGVGVGAVTAYALPRGWSTRLPHAVGWMGMVGWLSLPRPEGGYAISSDLSGYALLGAGLALLVHALVTLPRPRPAARPETQPARP